MKLIIHPGHAKCGSTTIQRFLRENRQLFHINGILIPDGNLLMPEDKGFQEITETPRDFFEQMIQENNLNLIDERLKKISENHHYKKIIISAENLTNHLGGPGEAVHHLFRKHFTDITIIYYIKPQDSFILSSWQQWGYKEGIPLGNYITRSINRMAPNYFHIVQNMEALYGKENLKIKPLSKTSLYNGDLIHDLLHTADIDIPNIKYSSKEVNKSLSPLLCEVLSSKKEMFSNVHDESIKTLLVNLTNNNELLYTRFDEMMSTDQRQHILNRFKEHNHYLHTNYFPEFNFDEIFKAKTFQPPARSAVGMVTLLEKENQILKKMILEIINGIKQSH